MLGDWALDGATILLSNEPGESGCAVGDSGEYTVAFDAECAAMTWTLVSDDCDERSAALNGGTFMLL